MSDEGTAQAPQTTEGTQSRRDLGGMITYFGTTAGVLTTVFTTTQSVVGTGVVGAVAAVVAWLTGRKR